MRAGVLMIVGALAAGAARPAFAEEAIIQGPFYEKIFMGMAHAQDDPRSAAAECAALREPLKSLDGVSEAHRLYLEAMIEHCIAFAMNKGEFKDETGGQCEHHYAFVSKLAGAIDGWTKEPDFKDPNFAGAVDKLESGGRFAEQMGCKEDYTGFAATLAAAQKKLSGSAN